MAEKEVVSHGKVLKKIAVNRGGKIHYRKQWVRVSGAVEEKKKAQKEGKEPDKGKKDSGKVAEKTDKKPSKKESGDNKLHDQHLKDLKDVSKKLNGMKPNTEQKFKSATVKKLGDGSYTIKAHGKKMLVHGTSAASMLVDYAHKAGSTGGAFATGDYSGQGIQQSSVITEGAKKVEQKVKQKLSKPEKKKEEKKPEAKKEKSKE